MRVLNVNDTGFANKAGGMFMTYLQNKEQLSQRSRGGAFSALGITVADFQIAGGLILLILATRELVTFGPQDRGGADEFGIVPLGMPLIAGPALLTALLILIDTVGVVFTLVSLVVNLAIVAVALCNADRFSRWMGKQGLRGISKIIALLLAAIAVSLIRRGWQMH